MSRDDYYDDDRPRRRRANRDDWDDDYDGPPIARRRRSEAKGEENIGLAVTSLVLGIISVVIFCFWPISMPLAVMAIIFGAIGMNQGGRGMAVAGLVCGVSAIVLFLTFFIIALTSPTWMGPRWWWGW